MRKTYAGLFMFVRVRNLVVFTLVLPKLPKMDRMGEGGVIWRY